MTGGTALPADTNPPTAPGASDQPSGPGQPAGPGPLQDQQPGKLPGLPRLFFADQAADQQAPGQRDEIPAGQGESGSAWSARPNGYGTPPQAGGPASRGQRRAPWQADQGQAPGQARQGLGPGRAGTGQPSQRPDRPRRTNPPGRELRQRGIACLVFGVMSLVAILFGFGPDPSRGIFLVIFSALVGIAAIVIGVSAIVKARKTGSYRPRGVIGGIGLGALAALISLAVGTLYLAFPNQTRTYVNCLNQAQTTSQRQACLNQLEKSINAGLPSTSPGGLGLGVPGSNLQGLGLRGLGGQLQGSVDGPRRAGESSS